MHRDRLFNAQHGRVARAAMHQIDKMQDVPAEERVAAAAAVFMLLTNHYGVRPTDAIEAAGNMIEQAGGVTAEFRAVQDYIKYEFPK